MALEDRRLCVHFTCRGVRYAVDAVSVLEVAQRDGPGAGPSHVPVLDLGALLGGEGRVASRPGTAVVLDVSPTVAVQVDGVSGVFDSARDEQLPLHGALAAALGAAVRQALVHHGALVFELDPDGLTRGLPPGAPAGEPIAAAALDRALVCEVDGGRVALPLGEVLQVVPFGPAFNPAPGPGRLAGALAFRGQLCPVYRLAGARTESLIVVCERAGGLVGLTVSRAVGVSTRPEEPVLDLARMFS